MAASALDAIAVYTTFRGELWNVILDERQEWWFAASMITNRLQLLRNVGNINSKRYMTGDMKHEVFSSL